ncbi:RodZ family helix-turn-helix domain-containing protein [Streptococcus sp. sy004]|uniref:helix-turn-helix domain-containing protein n=1 Tax=Streptococcus sp. sy004 TaxID=2600149 RepID=UPI0011B75AE9|nr:helix-turn-helix domain-containing protein [Streptococcus sp. sy004]TWT11077.1 hypothetical protein FRX54_04235 [Streptococcus sp. sy004]
MREASIGELLRQARTKKGYDLEQIAELSEVPRHYLLAMEMDQFKLLPQESVNSFIEQYAEVVDLDGVSLIHGYRNMKLSQQQSQEKVDFTKKDTDSKSSQKSLGIVKRDTVEEVVATETIVETRSSRHKDEKKSYLPFLTLLALSLAIVGFLAYITWQQMQNNLTPTTQPSYSMVSSSSSESESSASASTEASASTSQPSLTTTGGEDNLEVALSNPSSEVVISFQLVEGEESWVAAYTDQLGEQGALLTPDNLEYQVTLPQDVVSTVLTLGNAQGLAVTIDGQKLDLSALTSSLSYVTLTIQQ